MSLRETIFAVNDLPQELVDVPEWGVVIQVRGMSHEARLQFLEKFGEMAKAMSEAKERGEEPTETVDTRDLYEFLLVGFCYDPETGTPVFQVGDGPRLLGKAPAAVERLAAVAMRLSGLGEAIEKAGKSSSVPGSTTETTETDGETSDGSIHSGSSLETSGAEASESSEPS